MPTMGLLPWSVGQDEVFQSVPIRTNTSSRKGNNPNGESVSISIRPNVYFIESTKNVEAMWKIPHLRTHIDSQYSKNLNMRVALVGPNLPDRWKTLKATDFLSANQKCITESAEQGRGCHRREGR